MRPDLLPEGSLAQFEFADLIQGLHERHWTGSLTLSNRGVGRSVQVQEGRLVFASSSDPDDRLGEVLLRRGRISLRQYVDAGKAIGPGKRLGAILVEQGVLPKDLVKAVVEHTQEIIYGAFLWTEGHFRLQAGQGSSEAITLKMSTPDLIMEGIRRIETWSRIDRAVGGLQASYGRVEGTEQVAKAMTLSPAQVALLDAVGTATTIQDLTEGSTLPDFDVCRAIWGFRVIGLIRRTDAPLAPAPVSVEDEGLDLFLSTE